MPAPNPFAPTDPKYFSPLDWKELVAGMRPSGGNFFSQKSGEASVIGLVPVEKVTACLRFCVGYNNISAGPTVAILRTNPVAHPRYPKLFCTSAAETDFVPNAAALKVPAEVPAGGTPSLLNYTGYKKTHITLRFQPLPYAVKEDGSITPGQEWERNTYIDQEPRVEVLSLSGFQMVYAEGAGCPDPPYSNPVGQKYPAEIGQVLTKSDLRVTWDLVPENYIMKTGTKIPYWPLYCLGCVNLGTFFGYDEGTLLFSGMKLTRHPWPLALGTETDFLYTVEFLLNYFNPEKGLTGDPPVQIATNLGHNNFPWRGKVGGGDPNAGKWFYASYTGDIATRAMYQYLNFANLFNCAQNAYIP